MVSLSIDTYRADQTRVQRECGLHRSDTDDSLHYTVEVWFKNELLESPYGMYWHVPPVSVWRLLGVSFSEGFIVSNGARSPMPSLCWGGGGGGISWY